MMQADVFSNAEIMEIMTQRPADGAKYLKRAAIVRRILREANEEVVYCQRQIEERLGCQGGLDEAIRSRDADINFIQSCCDHVFFEGKCVCCGAAQ
jgi:hypothetical protein